MIKKLQKKFIIINVISIFSIVTIMLLFINILSFSSMNKQLDELADKISENGGFLEKPKKDPNDHLNKPNGDKKHEFINPETPFATRYFTVYYNQNNEVIRVDTDSIYSVNNEQAIEYATHVVNNKERGWIHNFRYKLFNTNQGRAVVFIDGRTNILSVHQTLLISFIVLYSAGLLILLIMILLSKKAINPISEAYIKQKQFITDANHELKTPLTLILANLDIAETELGENEWLSDIRSSGQKMTALVNKLVELSRMDEDDYQVILSKINISDILKDITSEFKYLCENNEISLDLKIDDNIYINAEETLIRKLIYLLMDNAAKYCDKNGSITVVLQNNKSPMFSIANTYKAVNNIHLDKLFDRFYRSDKARTFNGGHGVGLSIAKNIVSAHKGTISANKEGNDVIKFIVQLPK